MLVLHRPRLVRFGNVRIRFFIPQCVCLLYFWISFQDCIDSSQQQLRCCSTATASRRFGARSQVYINTHTLRQYIRTNGSEIAQTAMSGNSGTVAHSLSMISGNRISAFQYQIVLISFAFRANGVEKHPAAGSIPKLSSTTHNSRLKPKKRLGFHYYSYKETYLYHVKWVSTYFASRSLPSLGSFKTLLKRPLRQRHLSIVKRHS